MSTVEKKRMATLNAISASVQEDFGDKVKAARKRLAAFARRRARITKKKWALKYDRLFFNGKVFVFDQESNRVRPFSTFGSDGE